MNITHENLATVDASPDLDRRRFLAYCRERLDEMRSIALDATGDRVGDADQRVLARLAHQLRPALHAVGIEALDDTLAAVQRLLDTGCPGGAALLPLLNRFGDELDRLRC